MITVIYKELDVNVLQPLGSYGMSNLQPITRQATKNHIPVRESECQFGKTDVTTKYNNSKSGHRDTKSDDRDTISQTVGVKQSLPNNSDNSAKFNTYTDHSTKSSNHVIFNTNAKYSISSHVII